MKYKTHKRNTPIATLIKNYLNKKSGKVTESRKEIQWRFNYLDWKDQKKILLAFLDSGKADRQWAYQNLYRNWDKCFEPKVKEVWEKWHEPQCARSVIRFFPVSYVKENMESFTELGHYYYVCWRLAEDPNFVVDKSKLSTINYLSVLYHTERKITDEEANDVLFKIVHEMCVAGFTFNDMEDIKIGSSEMFTPANFRSIGLAKYYLRKMGFNEPEERFDEWDEEVRQYISLSPEYRSLPKADEALFENVQQKTSIVRKYAYLALDRKYKQPTDSERLKFLASGGWPKITFPKITSSAQKATDMAPSDPLFLEKAQQTNPSVKSLMDVFGLEIE